MEAWPVGTGPLPLSDRREAEIGTWGRTPRGSGSFQAAPSRLHGQIHRASVNCSLLSAHRESREGAGERWTGTAQPSGPLPVRPLLPGLPPTPRSLLSLVLTSSAAKPVGTQRRGEARAQSLLSFSVHTSLSTEQNINTPTSHHTHSAVSELKRPFLSVIFPV